MDSRDVLEGITIFTLRGGSLRITAKLDSTARVGIIKRSTANETGYRIAGIESPSNAIMDSAGISYGPVGQIELRYHKRRGSRSQEERFYVVEDDARFMDASYDVILGVTSHLCSQVSGGNQLLPIGLEPQSQDERLRQEQRKREAEMQREVDEKMVEGREANIRECNRAQYSPLQSQPYQPQSYPQQYSQEVYQWQTCSQQPYQPQPYQLQQQSYPQQPPQSYQPQSYQPQPYPPQSPQAPPYQPQPQQYAPAPSRNYGQ